MAHTLTIVEPIWLMLQKVSKTLMGVLWVEIGLSLLIDSYYNKIHSPYIFNGAVGLYFQYKPRTKFIFKWRNLFIHRYIIIDT